MDVESQKQMFVYETHMRLLDCQRVRLSQFAGGGMYDSWSR